MNKRQAEKWAKALESGKYKQGKQRLKNKDAYCCLGVLCEINDLPTVGAILSSKSQKVLGIKSRVAYLGKPVFFDGEEHDCLASLNDFGLSFKKIAKIIRKQYRSL